MTHKGFDYFTDVVLSKKLLKGITFFYFFFKLAELHNGNQPTFVCLFLAFSRTINNYYPRLVPSNPLVPQISEQWNMSYTTISRWEMHFILAIESRTENCENLKCLCPSYDYRFILQLPLKNWYHKYLPSINSDNIEVRRRIQFLISDYHLEIGIL